MAERLQAVSITAIVAVIYIRVYLWMAFSVRLPKNSPQPYSL